MHAKAAPIEALDIPAIADERFDTLDIDYHAPSQSLWMSYKAEGTPYYSLEILNDIARLRDILQAAFRRAPGAAHPLRYLVMASNKPGVFNLGGDLAMFADAVRTADSRKLRMYAYACVELIHGLTTAFGLPIVTVSVVQGRAFGGGLEAALAEDFIIASPDAQMGVPEVAFNSFPGMGAVSLLSRRLGTARAEEIIASGALYSGRHMFELGVVDVLADGPDAHGFARRWMAEGGGARFARRLSLARARRALFPVPHEELVRITDMWVDCACAATPNDIRHMERLASAQRRLIA